MLQPEASMPQFHFRIRNRSRQLLAEDDIQETDLFSAGRAIMTALALFSATQGFQPDGMIELDDDTGRTVVRMNLKGEPLTLSRVPDLGFVPSHKVGLIRSPVTVC